MIGGKILYGMSLQVQRETGDGEDNRKDVEREERERLLDEEIQRLQALAEPGTDTGRIMLMSMMHEGADS